MAMVRYVGPHDAVEITTEDEKVIAVERQKSVEVSDELAKRLLEQDTWEKPRKEVK
jgi:hypothetical protein